MDLKLIKDELLELSRKDLKKEDRERVQEIANQLGVTIHVKTRCKDCYADAIILLYREVNGRLAAEAAENDERSYILRPGVDVIFGRIRVNEATITDELAERLIARGFERKFFVKCG